MFIDDFFGGCVCVYVVKLYGKSLYVFGERVYSFIRILKGSMKFLEVKICYFSDFITWDILRSLSEKIFVFFVLILLIIIFLREIECFF